MEHIKEDVEKLEKDHLDCECTLVQTLYIDGELKIKTYYLENTERLLRYRKVDDKFTYEGHEIRQDNKLYRYDQYGNFQHTYTISTYKNSGGENVQEKIVREDGNTYYYYKAHGLPKGLKGKIDQYKDHLLGWAYKDGTYSVYIKDSYWRA